MDSILNSIKKQIGYDEDYTPFDEPIIVAINSALRCLNQLGVGKSKFEITDSTEKWSDFLGKDESKFSMVKTFVYDKVKLAHDPPGTSYLINLLKDEIKELEWKLNVDAETYIDDEEDE